MRLILASASPRRAELLGSAGFAFEIAVADVDETPREGESPERYTERVARDKARRIAGDSPARDVIVLAADTEVVSGGRVLGKPADAEDAARMLRLLSGRVHDVLTAVVVIGRGREQAVVERTAVRFVQLGQADIQWYVGSGEPMGKAGAYAIQGRGARFIDRIEGSWSNVVGLPLHAVHRLLSEVQ